ncbi:helix-turn-helix domain-containing protein [Maribrevibacterium harenarium]|uniref:Helix-turn-helix domain-containing protein n=1 Tax=Maribrevibacterium harenarium TaxID=2589817 RepID=A0A501WHW8_9GAMM|nr:AraC family transcriptional regulator [Maribrevibacterium harenarium]TPE49483.1 helix-turn-helix domain-containing protein [Maribrevibacterium harenarium]
MQIYKIETDELGREVTTHGSPDFPCGTYNEWFSLFFNHEVPWHWHEEIEVVLVVSGATRVQTTTQETIVRAGEAVFVNSNILHRLTKSGEEDCHILNAVFHPTLLSGQSYNLVYKKQVLPLTQHPERALFHFKADQPWQQVVISTLGNAFSDWEQNTADKEMVLTMALMFLWQQLSRHTAPVTAPQKQSTKQEHRLHKALNYLHQHFAEPLSVKAVADAANMSESECYRLFRSLLNTTPIGYLTEHRLRLAAETISTTDLPIAMIADNTGFTCPAYFAKKFKQQFGVTPKGFRAKC